MLELLVKLSMMCFLTHYQKVTVGCFYDFFYFLCNRIVTCRTSWFIIDYRFGNALRCLCKGIWILVGFGVLFLYVLSLTLYQ